MVLRGNSFALLEDEDSDDVESLLSRVAVSAAKAEQPPSEVEKQPNKLSSNPLHSSDQERHDQNGVERYNPQENNSQLNNGGDRYKKRANGNHKDENQIEKVYEDKQQDESQWQDVYKDEKGYRRRQNRDSGGYNRGHGHGSAGERKVNGERRERGYGGMRVVKGENANGEEEKVYEDKKQDESQGQDGVSGGIMEKFSEVDFYNDEKEYRRRRNRDSGGYNRGYQGYRHGSAGEGKVKGKSYELKELQKDGDTNAGEEGEKFSEVDVYKDVKQYRSIQNRDSRGRLRGRAGGRKFKGKSYELQQFQEDGYSINSTRAGTSRDDDAVGKTSKEAAGLEEEEEELEPNKMTLKEYEKQLEEKRKALESLNTEERKVSPDKDFESMQIVQKKNKDDNITDHKALGGGSS